MLMALLSCKEGAKDTLSFEDTVAFMEGDPVQFLHKLDTASVNRDLHNEKDATVFLLKSMCENYVNNDLFPDVPKIEECVSLISDSKDVCKQLESLFFLAKVYRHEERNEDEISTINKALDIAKNNDDNKWIFYLYSYLSEIYLNNVDLIRYAEFQGKAKDFYKNEDLKQTDIYTRLAIGKTLFYNKKYDKAIEVFKNISQIIGEKHAYYGYNHFFQAMTHFMMGDWKSCINHTKIALPYVHKHTNLFVCYSMLTHCCYSLGRTQGVEEYKKKALECYEKGGLTFIEIEFYKICAEQARLNSDVAEEMMYMNKIINVYNKKLITLNDNTLSVALLKYDYIKKEKSYRNKINLYKYIALSMVFVLIISITLYISKKKQQTYRLLLLNEQIAGMESLKSVSEEAKFMIARDIEIAKRISYLKYSNNEKSDKLIHEIEKLNIVNGNKLLNSQWNEFFRHIDIIFDGFHTRLIQKYPILTQKEIQLCCMLVAGFRTEEIAAVWQQSIYTVHKAKTNIRKKVSSAEGMDLISFLKKQIY